MKKRNWMLQKMASKDQDYITIENLLRRDALIECGSLRYEEDPAPYRDSIPVGDIPFVEVWLKENHRKAMVPIEVPEVLRTREYLGRTYEIMDRDKLPSYERGRYFVKNTSKLKEFNSSAYDGRIPAPSTLPAGMYLLSEWVDIRSEFRVFVYQDQVLAVQNYLGAPLVFPNPAKILKMVEQYKEDKGRPEAYTMDIAVTCQKDQSAGTVILEVHPFVSCGLYGFNHPWIPDMLEAGVQYYIKCTHGGIL